MRIIAPSRTLGAFRALGIILLAAISWSLIFIAAAHAQTISSGAVVPQPDPRLSTSSASLRQVTNRTRLNNGAASTGYTSASGRTWQISYVPIRSIRIGWANWTVSPTTGAEVGPGAASTVAWAVEYNGLCKQLTFAGAATGSIANGVTGYTDLVDLGFTIPAYTKFYIHGYVANATGMLASSYSNAADLTRGDRYNFNGSNQTAGCGVTTDNANGVYALFPSIVLARSSLRVTATIGDSTTQGIGDTMPDPSGGSGWYGRALARFGPQLNMGVGGDKISWFNASRTQRMALFAQSGADRVINGYGINDLNSGRTSAQVLADAETLRGFFPGMKVCDITIPPVTTSSDSYKTAAGQTVSDTGKNSQRLAYNAARRAGIATSPCLFDITLAVETSAAFEQQPTKDGGVWLPRFAYDGVHPNSAGYAALSDQIAGWLATQQ